MESIEQVLNDYVCQGEISGACIRVREDGAVLTESCCGTLGPDNDAPIQTDTVFRLMSMTKPVTAVVVMRFAERGLLHLDDLVSKYLPEYSSLTVANRMPSPDETDASGLFLKPEAAGSIYPVPASRPIRILDLLNHTSGLGQGPVGIGGALRLSSPTDTLPARIRIYGRVPCDFQPGTATGYSAFAGFDSLGAILERISGKDLNTILQEEICSPLGIRDLSFDLRPDMISRLCSLCQYQDGALRTISDDGLWSLYKTIPGRCSGSAGLYATLDAYDRFAQMLLGNGSLDGVQILKKETVLQMSHPTTNLEKSPGCIWGLGFLHFGLPALTKRAVEEDSYGWSGAYGTHFFIDPRRHRTMVLMLNRCDINGEYSFVSRKIEEVIEQTYTRASR